MAAGTISTPPERCSTGKVKSIEVAPHSPSAVERLRRIRPGINMMASSSRQRSLKNAALPMTGPKDSVSKIPESEYQPSNELAVTTTATIIPRRLRTICRRLIPLLRNWIPTRNRRKINVYSLASVACCKKGSLVRPSRKPSTTTPHSCSDSRAMARREGNFS